VYSCCYDCVRRRRYPRATLRKSPGAPGYVHTYILSLDVSACCYMCPHAAICVRMLLYVSACCCMCPHAAVCVRMLLYVPACCCMCLHAAVCVCMLLYVSACCCMCPHAAVCVCMLLYVSACCCMCPHAAVCVCMLLYESACCCMCPHTGRSWVRAYTYCYICLHVSVYCYISDLILLHMCPHAAIYVSACCYICVRILGAPGYEHTHIQLHISRYMCPHIGIYLASSQRRHLTYVYIYVCICISLSLSLSLSLSPSLAVAKLQTSTHTRRVRICYIESSCCYISSPHGAIYLASSYWYICVLILLCMCADIGGARHQWSLGAPVGAQRFNGVGADERLPARY
jgi:hypothetical protein